MAGAKDRETKQVRVQVVEGATTKALQGFVEDHVHPDAMKYTDEAKAYQGLTNHETCNHVSGKWVDGMAHTNGLESFWSMLKRGYHGVYHRMSVKHLHRYVAEFAGRHNIRDLHTHRPAQPRLRRHDREEADVQGPHREALTCLPLSLNKYRA